MHDIKTYLLYLTRVNLMLQYYYVLYRNLCFMYTENELNIYQYFLLHFLQIYDKYTEYAAFKIEKHISFKCA